jgi:hypothetical protein
MIGNEARASIGTTITITIAITITITITNYELRITNTMGFSLLTPHSLLLTPYSSLLTVYCLPFTPPSAGATSGRCGAEPL